MYVREFTATKCVDITAVYTWQSLIEVSYVYMYECVHVGVTLLQGRSHRYGWSGFNWTTFRGNNHISANIHEFGGAPSRPVGSHVATVDRVRDQWLK